MCEAFGKCGACIYEANCTHGHLGTGDSICSDFECSYPEEICSNQISCFDLHFGIDSSLMYE